VPVERSDRGLPDGCLPRGLSRVQAAAYVGVGVTKFDHLVKTKVLPGPYRYPHCNRLVWDRHALDKAIDALAGGGLASSGFNEWEALYGDRAA
jgi:hypothetical protein